VVTTWSPNQLRVAINIRRSLRSGRPSPNFEALIKDRLTTTVVYMEGRPETPAPKRS